MASRTTSPTNSAPSGQIAWEDLSQAMNEFLALVSESVIVLVANIKELDLFDRLRDVGSMSQQRMAQASARTTTNALLLLQFSSERGTVLYAYLAERGSVLYTCSHVDRLVTSRHMKKVSAAVLPWFAQVRHELVSIPDRRREQQQQWNTSAFLYSNLLWTTITAVLLLGQFAVVQRRQAEHHAAVQWINIQRCIGVFLVASFGFRICCGVANQQQHETKAPLTGGLLLFPECTVFCTLLLLTVSGSEGWAMVLLTAGTFFQVVTGLSMIAKKNQNKTPSLPIVGGEGLLPLCEKNCKETRRSV